MLTFLIRQEIVISCLVLNAVAIFALPTRSRGAVGGRVGEWQSCDGGIHHDDEDHHEHHSNLPN
jgi:hypothetical protein